MKTKVPDQWASMRETAADYWRLYGGWRGLVQSPYLALSGLITAVCAPAWFSAKFDWAQSAIEILPGLLGFSIGAFAVILVFSSDRIINVLAEDGARQSMLMKTAAMFVHFIITQVTALLSAIICKIYPHVSVVGFFLLIYALTLAVATCFALFNLAQIYNALLGIKPDQSSE